MRRKIIRSGKYKILTGGEGESFVKIFNGTLKSKSFTITNLNSIEFFTLSLLP